MTEFFGQLAEFSARVFKAWKLPTVCRWTRDLGPKKFLGAVIHYTEGQRLGGTVKWFMDHTLGAKASAHVVVAPTKLEVLDALAGDLPLVQALPVTVVQCVPPDRGANHTQGFNAMFYGVENVNAGWLVKGRTGGYRYGKEGRHVYQEWRSPVWAFEKWWDAFPRDQVIANIMILRALALESNGLRPSGIVGHEHVQSTRTPGTSRKDKWDPGPLFPLQALRESLRLYNVMIDDLKDLAYWATDPRWFESWRDGVLLSRGKASTPGEAWDLFYHDSQMWLDGQAVDDLRGVCLNLLGYDMSEGEETAVVMFQRLMGLAPVGKFSDTALRHTLVARLDNRGIIDGKRVSARR